MQCQNCSTENREGASFCRQCGADLVLLCPQCGRQLPADSRFCDNCGAQLRRPEVAARPAADIVTERLQRLVPKEYAERLRAAGGRVAGQRRTVTILFSDVKGSTTMAENLDPEDVMEIMDGAFGVLIEPIFRYEGTLARLMGDAILAFFGAPIAHEDDPERACRAALDIIEGAKRYAVRLEQERGLCGFDVRVGINTGLVVVGEVGSDSRVEYTAMGDAVNLAARMESAAEPGTVLISEATHKLIGPLFETEALGPIEVKGKSDPVPVFRVLSPRNVPGKVRGIAGLESPLVGREAESAALQQAIKRLQAGVGGIVTIVGEAGLGKSRLVAEIRHVGAIHELPLHELHLQWVEGRCLSYGTSIAYLLWLDVLRGLISATVEDSPQRVLDRLKAGVGRMCPEGLDDIVPYVARLMSMPQTEDEQARLDHLDGQELKSRTFEAVRKLIECMASEAPLVLVCEDLHWADRASMELLEQLFAVTDRAPVLFICAFRPNPDHGSWRLREAAAREYRHRHTDVRLQPLLVAESDVLVGNLLGVEQMQPALKQRILEAAEGNPFYVEEIIRSLIDQGAIVRDAATGRWQATRSVVDIPIPDTLQGVLMARIDRLQEEVRRVLGMASVIGRLFLYRVLEAIAQEERQLDEHLLTLQREEMIRERARIPELEYIFKHELTREAAYNGLLKAERRKFHRQAAEALERLFPERIEEQVGLLAHHWERAGDAEKATEYLLRAGDQARWLYSHDQAIRYYERALTLLRESGQHARAARTWMKLGTTHHNAFDFRGARQAYQEGFALWQRAGTAADEDLRPAPHALRLAFEGPLTLDPAAAVGSESDAVIHALFGGLVEQTADMDIVPDVARTWDVLDGGRTYVFHLRDDVCWSDGTPVTAQDFAYAWQRVLDPATGSRAAHLLYDIRGAQPFHHGQVAWQEVGVRVLDAGTLLVELEEPAGYFLQLLDHACTLPVPRHVMAAPGPAWAVGENLVSCGPYRLESGAGAESLTLVRNPRYHGRFGGNVERVELSLGVEPPAQLEMYESDRLDILNLLRLSPSAMLHARRRHAGEYLTLPRLHTIYLAFNARRPPFDDVRVRRAFAMAVDREMIVDEFFKDMAFPATGGFISPGMPGHSPGIALPYDPDQARQLLAEAGYPPGGTGSFPSVEWLGELGDTEPYGLIQTQWREILGVELEWEQLEFAALVDRLAKRPPDIWALGWVADYPDPGNFLGVGFPWGATGWRNEVYEGLVQKARVVQDQGERLKLYQQADRILVEEAAIAPQVHTRFNMLVKPWVRRFPMSAIKEWFWKDVVIEPH